MSQQPVKFVDTEVLRVAYVEDGPADGWPVMLVHGFPYDVHAFEADARLLVSASLPVGARSSRPEGEPRRDWPHAVARMVPRLDL